VREKRPWSRYWRRWIEALRNKSEPGGLALRARDIAYRNTTIVLAFWILSGGAAETVHCQANVEGIIVISNISFDQKFAFEVHRHLSAECGASPFNPALSANRLIGERVSAILPSQANIQPGCSEQTWRHHDSQPSMDYPESGVRSD
jgi:hypothetical protein